MLAPSGSPSLLLAEAALHREAVASVALDHDETARTYVVDDTAPDEEVVEEVVEEREEVVIEPDLPAEEPAELTQYQRMVAAMPEDEPVYVAGNRAPRLKVGDYTLQPGDVVPGAHGWPRREAYERLGRIERR